MSPTSILVTGGCGFVGSSLSLKLKERYPESRIIALDNFVRKGSERNRPRLEKNGIEVVTADVREAANFLALTPDLIIDCAAEPSVMAGKNSDPRYAIETNLGGTINCLELARQTGAGLIFLSSSRIYPLKELNAIAVSEKETRFEISEAQNLTGITVEGVSETFPLGEERTLYGATKLSSELLIREYCHMFGIKAVISRCGVIAGPWQFGKVDQGIATLWMAKHVYGNEAIYIGFGGTGKQVRDFLHIEDLWSAIQYQIEHLETLSGQTFNLGGGPKGSVSLVELTTLCEKLTGNKIHIGQEPETRWGDVKLYVSDSTKFTNVSGWEPKHTPEDIMRDIYAWMSERKEELAPIFG
jgi:CDP-paratose 2-epimerase